MFSQLHTTTASSVSAGDVVVLIFEINAVVLLQCPEIFVVFSKFSLDYMHQDYQISDAE